jgi:hypothetical protein
MRTVLAIVFGIIAAAAAGVWLIATLAPREFATKPAVASSPAAETSPATAPLPEPAPAPTEPEPEGPPAAPGAVNEEIQSRSILSDDSLAPEEMQPQSAPEEAMRSAEAAVSTAPVSDAYAPEAPGAAAPAAEPVQAPAPASPPAIPLAEQFKARQVTYNRPPATLLIDRTIDVSLVINATEDASAGAEALQGFPGTVVEREVQLSDSVSAQLTGVGFDIETQTVARQKLSGRTINRWQWRVTPREPGDHTLILEIFGYASGSDDAEPLDAYRDEIRVEVQQVERLVKIASEYQPLFAAIAGLAGLISAFFAFMRFREERRRGAGS